MNGRDTAGTADLNCPGGYLIPWHAMLSNKTFVLPIFSFHPTEAGGSKQVAV